MAINTIPAMQLASVKWKPLDAIGRSNLIKAHWTLHFGLIGMQLTEFASERLLNGRLGGFNQPQPKRQQSQFIRSSTIIGQKKPVGGKEGGGGREGGKAAKLLIRPQAIPFQFQSHRERFNNIQICAFNGTTTAQLMDVNGSHAFNIPYYRPVIQVQVRLAEVEGRGGGGGGGGEGGIRRVWRCHLTRHGRAWLTPGWRVADGSLTPGRPPVDAGSRPNRIGIRRSSENHSTTRWRFLNDDGWLASTWSDLIGFDPIKLSSLFSFSKPPFISGIWTAGRVTSTGR